MDLTRTSGVLLHPTSLPGPHGRGDLGPAAYAFLTDLARAGQRVWQVLPVGPPGYGGSPYAGSSAFAGDTLLISPELLVDDGLLAADDLVGAPELPEGQVSDDGSDWRRALLARAWGRFQEGARDEDRSALAAFRRREAYWLEDYALFVALKAHHGGGAFWTCWPRDLWRALPHAVRAARREHAPAIEQEVFSQWLFDRQWRRLRDHARELGVQVVGDLPIYVARDCADVWQRPELFELGPDGEPTAVAGCPPDAFAEDGQLWGNPLYDWPLHARTAYAWWIERTRRALDLADVVRIDHFRGFASYWEVPAADETAKDGNWIDGPRMALFDAIRAALGDELPIVAEDLGEVTPDVPELLEATGFPGMRIMQFAFYDDDPEHTFKLENHVEGCVVYTGTHDNETTAGWYAALDDEARTRVQTALGATDPDALTPHDVAWGLIGMVQASPAYLAIIPAQDLLGLDNAARMNFPGKDEGNWGWRLLPGQLTEQVWDRLRALSREHGR
jgi:4-alpha-glucanotransferase